MVNEFSLAVAKKKVTEKKTIPLKEQKIFAVHTQGRKMFKVIPLRCVDIDKQIAQYCVLC